MVDRGFQIHEDLLLHFRNLQLPPGARTKSQMTKKEVQKTKEIANLRIHAEMIIIRIKNDPILKGTMPITLMNHVDEIFLCVLNSVM